MPVEELDEIVTSLEGLLVPAMLTELRTRKFIAVNDLAADLFGSPVSDLIGHDVLPHIDTADREATRVAYAAMADKVIDGYQVRRRIVKPDGKELMVSVSGRRIDGPNKLYGLWILLPGLEPTNAVELTIRMPDIVLAVTDHDWQIEYMSADAGLLGVQGSELRGFPILGLVHPSAVTDFLAAVTRTAVDHLAVTVLVRMRVGHDRWNDRYCLINRMCEHDPPRLGVVISAVLPTDLHSRTEVVEQAHRCAVEAQASNDLDALPGLKHLPLGSELSVRQTEIVAKLIAGERIPEIASSMYLSPSTVRNHLAVIYRKFGVHSQAELLAAILRASSAPEG
jgi:PAS domain S-box-containing protein